MAEQKAANPKRVLTPKFRVSFPSVFKAKSFEDQEAKYSVTMLFDKATDLSKLKAAANFAIKEKWGDKVPKNLRTPFRNGDEKEFDGYENTIFVSASSKQRPGVVDKDLTPIVDEGDFYAGCYARATLTAFAYDTKGNKGVSFGLQNLQKLGDGDSFSGRKKAEDDFEAFDDGSLSEDNYNATDDSDFLK